MAKLTPAQSSEKYDITMAALQAHRKKGTGPKYTKNRGRIYYSDSAMQQFIKAKTPKKKRAPKPKGNEPLIMHGTTPTRESIEYCATNAQIIDVLGELAELKEQELRAIRERIKEIRNGARV